MAPIKRSFLHGDNTLIQPASDPAGPPDQTHPDEAAAPIPRLTAAVLPPDEAIRDQAASDEAVVATEEIAGTDDAFRQPAAPTDNQPTAPPLPDDLESARRYQADLQRKMTALAEDLSLGKINQLQFDAVYAYYREQRDIIDALIGSMAVAAWRKAIRADQTRLLLERHAARLVSYALYFNADGALLAASGQFDADAARIAPVLAAQRQVVDVSARINRLEVEGGHWLCFVPGHYTTLVAHFTHDPARAQLQLLQELHHDFELAGAKRLTDGRAREAAEAFMRTWALIDPA